MIRTLYNMTFLLLGLAMSAGAVDFTIRQNEKSPPIIQKARPNPRSKKIPSMADAKTYKGFDLELSYIGSAFGLFYQRMLPGNLQFIGKFNWMLITGGEEYTVYDQWGYAYKINEVSLDFLRLNSGLKYHLFRGQLANSFSPFVMGSAGIILALDTPEYSDFATKVDNIDPYWGAMGSAYAGVDFQTAPQYALTVAAGYSAHLLPQKVDGQSLWSGAAVFLQYGKFIR